MKARTEKANSACLVILALVLGMSGCATAPVSSFEANEDGEIVETERDKSGSGNWWLGAAALVVAAVALSKSDGDSAPAKQNCYWVVTANGSTRVCD